jgi:hypothetical protein
MAVTHRVRKPKEHTAFERAPLEKEVELAADQHCQFTSKVKKHSRRGSKRVLAWFFVTTARDFTALTSVHCKQRCRFGCTRGVPLSTTISWLDLDRHHGV